MKTKGRRKSSNVVDRQKGSYNDAYAVGMAARNRNDIEWQRRVNSEPSEMGRRNVEGMRKIEAVNRYARERGIDEEVRRIEDSMKGKKPRARK